MVPPSPVKRTSSVIGWAGVGSGEEEQAKTHGASWDRWEIAGAGGAVQEISMHIMGLHVCVVATTGSGLQHAIQTERLPKHISAMLAGHVVGL